MNGCKHCPNKHQYPKSIGLDLSKWNYNEKKKIFTSLDNITLVTVSEWLKQQVNLSFLNKYHITRIYNGIDRKIFKPTDSTLRKELKLENKYVILCVSDGWSIRKGINIICDLSSKLREDEQIILIGFNSEKEIRKLPNGIIGIKRTDNVQQLVNYYSMADVLLNPSYEETFGLVTAEALSCGTPVIVQNRTACPELVNEKCGIIMNDENARKAIDLIRKKEIQQNDCIKQSELFDKWINYSEYIKLYHSILK